MTLALVEAAPAQSHPVVDHHVITDLRGFADHHAHAVVDEEPPADGGSGVDFDACEKSGDLGEHPGPVPASRGRPTTRATSGTTKWHAGRSTPTRSQGRHARPGHGRVHCPNLRAASRTASSSSIPDVFVQRGGHVALTEVGDDHHDELAGVLRALGQPQRRPPSAPAEIPPRMPSSVPSARATVWRPGKRRQ